MAALVLSAGVGCQSSSTDDGGRQDSGVDGGCLPVGFTSGQEVFVDAVAGEDDTKCACGSPEHPCKSLTYCMGLIAEAAVQGVTLHAPDVGRGTRVACRS